MLRVIAVSSEFVLGPALLSAQVVSPECANVATRDACRKTAKTFAVVSARLGTLAASRECDALDLGVVFRAGCREHDVAS